MPDNNHQDTDDDHDHGSQGNTVDFAKLDTKARKLAVDFLDQHPPGYVELVSWSHFGSTWPRSSTAYREPRFFSERSVSRERDACAVALAAMSEDAILISGRDAAIALHGVHACSGTQAYRPHGLRGPPQFGFALPFELFRRIPNLCLLDRRGKEIRRAHPTLGGSGFLLRLSVIAFLT